ncbi:acyltransferase domain-containing protein [Mycobacterium frederiksbergense]|uniref:Acyltransferase domain-containing protein n=1 Tax=Mycolicibacterium frederiksbergense TaxID=117567 RepID=A0A6H0S9H0_9MYCO|nr:type I polyketide synthase [Mycolicibacterium frederiksbergense]MCV7044012.1 acyltransferase domain-containing protein [Mycolicibacterium frederiksbergense]QIV83944.1 acyltransferase domain-containing protein [Mycolicibacterium frederiksbergense]
MTLNQDPTLEPIAIVGIGCRLAGDVNTPADLWRFLLDSGTAVGEVPAERWEPYLRRDPRNAAILKATTPWGSFLSDLPGFDAEFFGVSPREAELMDPQQRLALEVSWEALEDAGVPPRSLAGSDTAVLMGVNSDDYGKLVMEDLPGIEAWTGIGTALCGIANRVSHLLDLRGPSVALDAACAASLVAVHQACQLLRAGETSLALAGGVSALIGPGLTRVLDVAGATAPDGRCKSFDESADGYGRGEGAAVVVLKRLADAQRDNDRVLAIVRGGAVAQDGRTVGIMSPNGDAQEQMFRLTCRTAGIDPATIDFVEAHGTGTPTGDPVELTALSAVYGAGRADRPCVVGSVKPNTGHLEGGAGVVGLVKATLALHHEAIPPTAGVQTPTTAVDWSTNGLRVNTETESWPRTERPRRAAVCSYGYGGTIAHVLLEEAPAPVLIETPKDGTYQVIPVSGRSPSRLSANAEALGDQLRSAHHALTEVAGTLWSRRSHEPVRAAIIAEDHKELVVGLDALAGGERHSSVATGSVVPGAADGAVWVCSGHGSHWVGMGAELLREEPDFAAVIDAIDPIFDAELGFSARAALSSGEHGGTDQVQALTFAMQVGLAAVLRSRGAAPAAVIGHSVGEVAACVIAGVFDLTDGARIACYRARGFRAVQGQGAMALVALSFAEAEQRLAGQTQVVAAISAAPQSTVISGTADEVRAITADWSAQGIVTRAVNTDVAFHSPAMDDLTAELARLTGALSPQAPSIPLYSTAMADPRSTALRGPDYWVANLRGRVRFTEAVTAAAEDGHRLFLEIAAHPVVSHSIVDTLSHNGIEEFAVVPLHRRNMPEVRSVTTAIAALHCHGAPVALRPSHTRWAHGLPGTQWQHRRFWRTPAAPPGGGAVHDPQTNTLLGGRLEVTAAVPAKVWQTQLDMDTRPYPGDHPVQGTEIIPAAVLLNTFLTATGGDITDVRLRTPVAPARARSVQVVLQDRALALASRIDDTDASTDSDGGWLTHCTAVSAASAESPLPAFDIAGARARCTETLPAGHVVDTLAELGVAAMGFPWEITELLRGDGELLAVVRAEPDGSAPPTWAGLMDAATSAASTVFESPLRLRMPARIDRVTLRGAPVALALMHIRRTADGTIADVTIADAAGTAVGAIDGMFFDQLENPGGNDVNRMMQQLQWHPTSWTESARPSQVILVGGDAPTLAWCMRDLAAADVDHRLCTSPDEIPAALAPGAVVLVLPRPADAPIETVGLLHQALTTLLDRAAPAQLWALTRGVYEGSDIGSSPLWGFSRIAAAEHPGVWGGILDVADDALPIGALATLGGQGVVVVRDDIALTARLTHAESTRRATLSCSPAGTYLITGGTGTLGVRVAARLADLGARRIVLVSRSGIADRASWDTGAEPARTILSLEERGVSVRVAAVDIAAPGAADELRAVLGDLPPVRGVVHAAGVEAGALLAGTTVEDFAQAMRPKVDGTLTLHEVFPPGELDWLVLFSSCGYLAGFPGQGAYACANAFLDAFAQHRRSLGDRTTAVAWTAWRGLGMGSASSFVAAQLNALGMGTVGADDAMRALDLAVRADQAHIVVLPVTADAASVPMLADIAPRDDEDAGLDGLALPVGRDGVDTAVWVAELVVATVAAELGLPDDGVDPRSPLAEIGVDSIMTVALRKQLERKTGLALPPTLLWEHPTAAAVTTRIVEMLAPHDHSVTEQVGACP